MNTNISQMIYTAASFSNTNLTEVARSIGMDPSNLRKKIRRSTLKPSELAKIAKVLGAEYVFYYSFPNGSKIGTLEKQRPRKS